MKISDDWGPGKGRLNVLLLAFRCLTLDWERFLLIDLLQVDLDLIGAQSLMAIQLLWVSIELIIDSALQDVLILVSRLLLLFLLFCKRLLLLFFLLFSCLDVIDVSLVL